MFYRGAGPILLAKLGANDIPGAYKYNICTDSISVSLTVESGTHQGNCGPVPVEDDRYIKSQSAKIQLAFADVNDKNFALATLGTVVESTTGTVSGTAETLPENMEAGDVYFLGGLGAGHHNITALAIGTLVLGTDYTLEPINGMVTTLTDFPSGALHATYGYTNKQYVAMLNAGQPAYSLVQSALNRSTGQKGTVRFFKNIFDPAQDIDLQSTDDQVLTLNGSVLANQDLPLDSEFGQFGVRVL